MVGMAARKQVDARHHASLKYKPLIIYGEEFQELATLIFFN